MDSITFILKANTSLQLQNKINWYSSTYPKNEYDTKFETPFTSKDGMRCIKVTRLKEKKSPTSENLKLHALKQLIKEEIFKVLNENKTFILPTNVYYIDDSDGSKLRNVGFEPGSAVNEAEVILTLWDEYENMQKFEKESNIGSSTINKMKDVGFNIPKIDADSMFFTQIMPDLMDHFMVYADKGDEYEIQDKYTDSNGYEMLDCIDEEITGNNFSFNKTLNDKYQYMLIDDNKFKEFAEIIKYTLS